MCCRLTSRSRCCICTVVVLHLVILVSLVVALVLRYVVYQDIDFLDMPTDQRLIHRGSSSIFCKSHEIESYLMEKDDGLINSQSDFVYVSYDTDPRKNASLQVVDDVLVSRTGFGVKGTKNNVFHLLENSTASLELCMASTDGKEPTIEVWYYLTAGISNRDFVLHELESGSPLRDCDRCLSSGNGSLTLTDCSKPNQTVSLSANNTDDYSFILFNPMNVSMAVQELYRLKRVKYDLEYTQPLTDHAKIRPDDFTIVEFTAVHNDSTMRLVNIGLTYSCDPNVIVYMAFFFWLPLLLMVILGVLALYRQSRTGEYNLLASYRDTQSYGSLRS